MAKRRERTAANGKIVAAEAVSLIPGLPDDIAIECLARVPHESHAAARRVCRRWRRLMADPSFLRHRERSGFAEELLFLVQALVDDDKGEGGGEKDISRPPAYGIGVYNATAGTWRRAGTPAGVPVFAQCAAAEGRKLVVVGGWEPSTLQPVSRTMVLDLATGLWREGAAMPGEPRSLFACGAVGDKVVIAGGHDVHKNALKSALMYDVSADEWSTLPDMNRERDEPSLCAPGDGRCYVISGYCTERQGAFQRSMEWYDAGESRWRMEEAAWPESPAAAALTAALAVKGKVWRVEGGENGRVREWEGEETGWREVFPAPEELAGGARAVAMYNERRIVVAGGDGASEGRNVLWAMDVDERRWRMVEPPPGFGGFVYAIAAVHV